MGITNDVEGNDEGNNSSPIFFVLPSVWITPGHAGIVEVDRNTAIPFCVITGDHSIPFPFESCTALPSLTFAFQIWRR